MYLKDLPLTARCLGLIAKGPQWKSGSQGLSWVLNLRAVVLYIGDRRVLTM